MNNLNYFEIEKVMSEVPEASVYNIVGQGGCGKTFSIKKHLLNHFLETGKMFVYVRRTVDEVKNINIGQLFDDVFLKEPGIKEAIDERYMTDTHIYLSGKEFWICGTKDNGARKKLAMIGKAMSVKNALSSKGAPFNAYNRIFFDEAITDGYYYHGDRETELFAKIVDTVARTDNEDVKVFICGNPDHNIEQCPYFYNLHLDYNSIPANQILRFNTEALDGHIIPNNVVFVKVASESTGGFINLSLSGVFGTAESYMRLTGEVKTQQYQPIDKELMDNSNLYIEIECETAVIVHGFYHKSIFIYLTFNERKEPMIFICSHKFKGFRGGRVYSYYDAIHQRKDMKCDCSIWRMQWPSYLRHVENHVNDAILLSNIKTDYNYTAQTFLNLIGKSIV